MKSVVLDGDKIAEAVQKAKDKMINGEYDNNDLILRGDALKAIRQRCISEHLPFKSNTPVGARVLDALAAVYQVKPYKDVCGKWVSVKDRLPELGTLCAISYTKPGWGRRMGVYISRYDRLYKTFNIKDGYDEGFFGTGLNTFSQKYDEVTHWMPLPEPPEVTP